MQIKPFDMDLRNEVVQAYEALARKYPPQLAKRLLEKYKEEEDLFLQAVKDAAPSFTISFWAKTNCSKCYGRGYVGYSKDKDFGVSYPVTCNCAKNAFREWLLVFRMWYNDLKKISTQRDNHD